MDGTERPLPILGREWEKLAPAWIQEVRQGRSAHRNGLLDPAMLAACGDVRGLSVLDCGCGEGRFCRILLGRGAKDTLGVDLCVPMIAAATELQTQGDEYRLADAQNLGFLESERFDLAISYLNQCDLPDFAANTREVFRVLRPGGRFIIANLHPMRSCFGFWQKTPTGVKEHVILDRYLDEGERHWTMMGVEFTNFHRTLATYTREYLAAGFHLEEIIEPTVSDEMLKKYPELDDERRVPNFIIFILRK